MLVKSKYKNFICFSLLLFFCTLNHKTAFSCYPVAKKDFFFVKDRSQISWGNDNRNFVVYDNFTYPLDPGSQMPFVTPLTNDFIPADIIESNLPLTEFFRKSLINEDHLSNNLYANLKLKKLMDEYAQVQKCAHEFISGIEKDKANATKTISNSSEKHRNLSRQHYENNKKLKNLQFQKRAHEARNGAENNEDIAIDTINQSSKKHTDSLSDFHGYEEELKALRLWEKRSQREKEAARIAIYISPKRQEIVDRSVVNYKTKLEINGQNRNDLLFNGQHSSLAPYTPINIRANRQTTEEFSPENKKNKKEEITEHRTFTPKTIHYYILKIINYLMDNKLEALIYLLILFIPGFLSSTSRSS